MSLLVWYKSGTSEEEKKKNWVLRVLDYSIILRKVHGGGDECALEPKLPHLARMNALSERSLKEPSLSLKVVGMTVTLIAARDLSDAFRRLPKSSKNDGSYFSNRNSGQSDIYEHAYELCSIHFLNWCM